MAVPSQIYYDKELGRIHVTARAMATRMTARWKAGELYVSIPKGLSKADYDDALSKIRAQILAKKPAPAFHVGWRREYELFDIEIVAEPRLEDMLQCQFIGEDYRLLRIQVGALVDLKSAEAERIINKYLRHAPKAHFYGGVFKLAQELAMRHGLMHRIKEIVPGTGLRRLGTCSSSGVITLSYELAYLPLHLRQYVILHEFAHLDHLDHSEAFHRRANALMGGREKEFEAQLRSFKFPFTK